MNDFSQFSQADIKNLIALVNAAPIKGLESLTVAMLLQKLAALVVPESAITEPKPDPKPE